MNSSLRIVGKRFSPPAPAVKNDDDENSPPQDLPQQEQDKDHVEIPRPLPQQEQDKDHVEIPRPEPSTELLLPDGIWPGSDRFSLIVSKACFKGWTQQPSPCCAAASVAGACNASLGLAFDEPAALAFTHVAALYHSMLAEQAAKKMESVARLMGVSTIEPALEALRGALAAEDRSLGGRKEQKCSAKDALATLRTLAEAHHESSSASDGVEGGGEPDARLWSSLLEVLPPNRGAVLEEVAAPSQQQQQQQGEEDALDNDDDEGGGSGDCGAAAAGGGFASKVRSELKTLLSKLGGCEQLAPSVEKPSTWYIGNWGIHAAVRALRGPAFDALDEAAAAADPRLVSLLDAAESGRANLCSLLRSRTLVGLRCKGSAPPPIVVKKADDEEAIEAAWAALKAAFSAPRCCMILHIKGHYALMFALREWVEDDENQQPRRVREVLACRKGQRPTTWIDWSEIHKYITGWAGYNIMEVSAVQP